MGTRGLDKYYDEFLETGDYAKADMCDECGEDANFIAWLNKKVEALEDKLKVFSDGMEDVRPIPCHTMFKTTSMDSINEMPQEELDKLLSAAECETILKNTMYDDLDPDIAVSTVSKSEKPYTTADIESITKLVARQGTGKDIQTMLFILLNLMEKEFNRV